MRVAAAQDPRTGSAGTPAGMQEAQGAAVASAGLQSDRDDVRPVRRPGFPGLVRARAWRAASARLGRPRTDGVRRTVNGL